MTTIIVETRIRAKLLNSRSWYWCVICQKQIPPGPVLQLTRSTHAHPDCWAHHLAREDGRLLDELCECDLATYGAKARGAA